MEAVIGGRTDDRRFAAYLADWRAILDRRIDQAVGAVAGVDGVVGLVLAGSTGRDEAWPLSDIDLLPIYADDRAEAAMAEVERRRTTLLPGWIAEGWWTGLDIGKLHYRHSEVARALAATEDERLALLRDDRWYFGLDKGYRGRAVFNPDGLAEPLAAWWTANRFAPPVVALRLERTRWEVHAAREAVRVHQEQGDALRATVWIQSTVKWIWTHLLETWGVRDASLGRLGTQFARLAVAHGRAALPPRLDALCSLDPDALARRMAAAPDWVRERHDRSWRARRAIGEPLTRADDARDTMRVCSLYALRTHLATTPDGEPPTWLAIPSTPGALGHARATLEEIISVHCPELRLDQT